MLFLLLFYSEEQLLLTPHLGARSMEKLGRELANVYVSVP
jgi:hypothetical protein